MKIRSLGVSAAGVTLALLAAGVTPALADTTAPTAGQFASSNYAPSSVTSDITVDFFRAGDRFMTGTAPAGATQVRLFGVLRPGSSIDAPVASDGTFRIDLAPFRNRVAPMMTVTVHAVDAAGGEVAEADVLVDFYNATPPTSPSPTTPEPTTPEPTTPVVDPTPPPAPEPSEPSEPSDEIASDLKVDPILRISRNATGTAPAGTTQIALDVFGTSVFGTINADGSFKIPLSSVQYMLYPGTTVTVWAMNADYEIVETDVVISR